MMMFSCGPLNFMDGRRNMDDVLCEVRAGTQASDFQANPMEDVAEFPDELKASKVV